MINFLIKSSRAILNVLLIILLILSALSGLLIGYNSSFIPSEKITYAISGLILGFIIAFLIELCILTPIVVLLEINHKLELIIKKLGSEENKDETSTSQKDVIKNLTFHFHKKPKKENTTNTVQPEKAEERVCVPYWFCKKCNKENSGRNNTCWNCGTTREKETICSPYWFCKNCNKENSSKNNTCWNCGTTKSE